MWDRHPTGYDPASFCIEMPRGTTSRSMTVADMRGEFLESRSGDGRCPVFRDALTALDGNQHQPIEIAPTPSTLRAAWGWGRRCRGVELPAHRGGSSRPSRSSLPGPRAAWTSYQRGNCHRALTDDGTESSRSSGPSAIRWRRSTSLPAKPNGSTCTLSANVRGAMTAATRASSSRRIATPNTRADHASCRCKCRSVGGQVRLEHDANLRTGAVEEDALIRCRDAQDVAHLVGGHPDDVTQDDDGPLSGRQ